eukprot:9610754-Heterocapsa_arctica.AAC.1
MAPVTPMGDPPPYPAPGTPNQAVVAYYKEHNDKLAPLPARRRGRDRTRSPSGKALEPMARPNVDLNNPPSPMN